jgi:surfactin synthase thioesterase subunit
MQAQTNVPAPSRFLHVARPVRTPRIRLICFAYAGGSATVFHGWHEHVPSDVEVAAVQLPGRQERLTEPPLKRLDAIVENVIGAMLRQPQAPCILYGHSFGALIGYQVARRLQQAGRPAHALIVGARRAPQLPAPSPPLHTLPPSLFINELHLRYGTPLAILQNRDLMEIALPPLRADLEALETYVYEDGPPLELPIRTLCGRHDRLVTAQEMIGWREVTRGDFSAEQVDAGHFFMDTHRAWVLAQLADYMRP